MSFRSLRRGFTLIELLLVIGIIAILAAIVIVAINPTKQLGDARNAQRRADVNTILNAIYQYDIDHRVMPPTLPASTSFRELCKTDKTLLNYVCNSPNTALQELTGAYIVGMPIDPANVASTEFNTGYQVRRMVASEGANSGRVIVKAPNAELNVTIQAQR